MSVFAINQKVMVKADQRIGVVREIAGEIHDRFSATYRYRVEFEGNELHWFGPRQIVASE